MPSLNGLQQCLLVGLRFIIGWHLFYQGLGKLRAVSWSSRGYLENATGPLAGLFGYMAQSETLLAIADVATVWGLMLAGLLLMLGLLTRTAATIGCVLLLLFFSAAPPLTGFTESGPQGTELYVDKTFIEAIALAVVAVFPTGLMAGLDILVQDWRRGRDRYFGRRKY